MKNHIIFLLLIALSINAQEIQLDFKTLANQKVELVTFQGLETLPLTQARFNNQGQANLNLNTKVDGMGYLSIQGIDQNLIIALSDQSLKLKGDDFSNHDAIQVEAGEENKVFFSYSKDYSKQMQVLSAWNFLQTKYENEDLFTSNKKTLKQIKAEVERINKADEEFINQLPTNSYMKWFLPVRKLVSNVANIAQNQPQLAPQTIDAFRELDYADDKLFTSGLFKEAIDNHYWLIENSSGNLDQVYKEMKISIDAMQETLSGNELKFNTTFSYLFDLLEERSLFGASEYLAINVLDQNECEIDASLTKKLENYRKMKVGNQVADIIFYNTISKEALVPEKLSDLKSNYTLVVFGSSWCPACTEEIPEINKHYKDWKNKGVEVVLVALDTNKKDYENFTNQFDFISTCDFKKWNTQAVEDYYVNATPSMFLLDENRQLLLKPRSVKHANAWIDHYIKE